MALKSFTFKLPLLEDIAILLVYFWILIVRYSYLDLIYFF